MPQHKGKQTGTIAAPDLLFDLLLLSASYLYLPDSLAIAPCKQKDVIIKGNNSCIMVIIIPRLSMHQIPLS